MQQKYSQRQLTIFLFQLIPQMLSTLTSSHSSIGRVYNLDPAIHWDPLVWVWCHPAVHRLSKKHTLADTLLSTDFKDSVHSEQGRIQALKPAIHHKHTAIPRIYNWLTLHWPYLCGKMLTLTPSQGLLCLSLPSSSSRTTALPRGTRWCLQMSLG